MFKKLIKWSLDECSHLPWREKRSLFHTLVSEIMLQQTTVGTVINHFDRFIKEYPNLEALAGASEEEVLISWKGLGYYRRARNLRKAAIFLFENYGENIPLKKEELLEIPGIGEYTANALISIGHNKEALAIDANLERVIARIYGIESKKGPLLQKKIALLFKEKKIFKNINKLGARNLNEALMDLGRVYCQARRVDCLICPVNSSCLSYQNKLDPLKIPFVPEKKLSDKHDLTLLRFLIKDRGRLFGFVKNEKEWLSNQIEVPTFILSSSDPKIKQYPFFKGRKKFKDFETIKTAITKYKIENRLIILTKEEFSSYVKEHSRYQFFNIKKDEKKFSTTTIKILKKCEWIG